MSRNTLSKKYLHNILKNNNYRVTKDAIDELLVFLKEVSNKVAKNSRDLAKLTYRKTIDKDIIKYAIRLALIDLVVEKANKKDDVDFKHFKKQLSYYLS